MSPRQRQQILDNLDAIYREAYERAKAAGDERRMADLDASYQREQLLLEVLLDIRDSLAGPAGSKQAGPDPVTALETIRRITRLR
ncbi:MAG TPA: hypothetical protein VGQ06_05290 [Gemmatimonadales bacterium]|jgi:hypothetical protein|nr:hypothetical protein [Gemmatimonadales bacterium]